MNGRYFIKLILTLTLVLMRVGESYADEDYKSEWLNCTDAKSWYEVSVCSSELLSLEIDIVNLYQKMINNFGDSEVVGLKEDQDEWRTKIEQCIYHESNLCLIKAYDTRKKTLLIANSNNSYFPYREKKHCDELYEQEFLACLIVDIKPDVITYLDKFEVLVYEYPFIGAGKSKLLPGKDGKTYIVDLGGYLVSASEIVGNNACCNKYMPIFVTKYIGVSGDGRTGTDDCSQSGFGRCNEFSTLLAYRLDHPRTSPKSFSLTLGFNSYLYLGDLTSSDFIIDENAPSTYWDNNKGIFVFTGALKNRDVTFPIQIEFRPIHEQWKMKVSPLIN